MEGDLLLTQRQAEHLHQGQTTDGYLVMWVVTWNSRDYPRQAVARTTLIRPRDEVKLRTILCADSLDQLRQMLPRGLTCLPRYAEDDPVIVEVWL